ncbi:MAG: hypothetical protein JNJ50_27730 [Acidobacteria bacterium]|nr:hypothetical protein [Acidobacteriota bacterium]
MPRKVSAAVTSGRGAQKIIQHFQITRQHTPNPACPVIDGIGGLRQGIVNLFLLGPKLRSLARALQAMQGSSCFRFCRLPYCFRIQD